MRKIILVFLSFVVCLLGVSCTPSTQPAGRPEPSRVLEQADKNDLAKADINSPEGLAQATGWIYIKLSDGRMSVNDAEYKLEEFCSDYALRLLYKNREEFRRGISDFVATMNADDDCIISVEYAKTIHNGDKEASIERIQEHKSGKRFYFKQDFILENGQWRVNGDNITDAFKFEKSK